MPRIILKDGEALDFCNKHFPYHDKVYIDYGKNTSYDSSHPDYIDSKFFCHICKKRLNDNDD